MRKKSREIFFRIYNNTSYSASMLAGVGRPGLENAKKKSLSKRSFSMRCPELSIFTFPWG
jgi:hypothetical protein